MTFAEEVLLVALGDLRIVRRSWVATEVAAVSEIVTGDEVMGETVSNRYRNPYAPCAEIAVHFYVSDARVRRGAAFDVTPFHVMRCAWFTVTDGDPDSGHARSVFADLEYHDYGHHFASLANALAERDRLVAADAADGYCWDGTDSTASRVVTR